VVQRKRVGGLKLYWVEQWLRSSCDQPASRSTNKGRCRRLEKVPDGLFEGEEAVLHVIERIVAPLGLRVDESSPWVDARLSDGSRVQTRFLGTPFRP
jgi:type IV secretory pathway ATPase VirB11/archaellum biosynthesis ATPase